MSYRSITPRHIAAVWFVAFGIGAVGVFTETGLLVSLAGLLVIAVGTTVAANPGGVTDRIASRSHGMGPFKTQHSRATWRLGGVMAATIGAMWVFIGLNGSV